ncbi:MAG: hypothetical protein O3A00_21325 [Planctomycetota bacterium]|nr:hypothetical protein [Planctomycetota bacterium]
MTSSRCAIGLAIAAAIGIAAIQGCGTSTTGESLTYSDLKESLPSADAKSTGEAVKPESAKTESAKTESTRTLEATAESKTAAKSTTSESPIAKKPIDDSPGPPQIAGSIARVDPGRNRITEAKTDSVKTDTDTVKTIAKPASPKEIAKNPKREIKVLVPDRSFRSVDDALRISFDDIDLMKVVNMDPVPKDAAKYFPDWLSGLDNKRIRIRGFMIPGFQTDGLKGFHIARDTQLCCFGRDFKPYDVFPVYMKEGVTTRYIHLRPFDVTGVFHIKAMIDEDEDVVKYMYTIDDAIVIER